jgi:hypothetical protein
MDETTTSTYEETTVAITTAPDPNAIDYQKETLSACREIQHSVNLAIGLCLVLITVKFVYNVLYKWFYGGDC